MTPYPYELTLQDAQEGYLWLINWVRDDPQGLLHLGSVHHIDGCGVQLLMLAQQRRQQLGLPFRLQLQDEALLSVCRQAGLRVEVVS